MATLKQQTEYIRRILSSITGEVTAEGYFSYCGIYKNKLMFALYKNGNFYIRVSENSEEEVKSLGGIKLIDDNISSTAKYFYLLPDNMVEKLPDYAHWVSEAIEAARICKIAFTVDRENYIRYLVNMNVNIERMLKRIHIFTVPQFMERGAFYMCADLIKYGIEVRELLLFKLYGATQYRHIETFTDEEKRYILQKANQLFQELGLRQRFNIRC